MPFEHKISDLFLIFFGKKTNKQIFTEWHRRTIGSETSKCIAEVKAVA